MRFAFSVFLNAATGPEKGTLQVRGKALQCEKVCKQASSSTVKLPLLPPPEAFPYAVAIAGGVNGT